MIYKLFIYAFSLLTLANCQTVKEKDTADPTMESEQHVKENNSSAKQNIIYLKEGETKFFKEYEMNISFKSTLEDSRCPKGVNCIWAGNATVEITTMGTYTRPSTFKLNTIDNESQGYKKSHWFNGFTITLVHLKPENTTEKGFDQLKGHYTVALQIIKENAAASKNTEPTIK